MIVIETSSDSKKVLTKLSKIIISNKLSPCVNISKIKSTYIWENKIVEQKEYKLSIKTVEKHKDEIAQIVKENHNYEVFELSQYKLNDLNPNYTKWFKRELK
tara:strand:+ start:539 stop:844 length:306 start_codon:yes stop_codon:yes gene_type:complete